MGVSRGHQLRDVLRSSSQLEFDMDGEPKNPWARLDATGAWAVPPDEVCALLGLVRPTQLLWDHFAGEFQVFRRIGKSGIKLTVRPEATVEEWKQVLSMIIDFDSKKPA